jgi:ferric-dicitrate binding protein FerR (iron transport regulator)
VHRAWERTERRKTVRRWALPLAVAATIVLAVTILRQPESPGTASVPSGTVARVIDRDNGTPLPMVGAEIFPGDRLATGERQGINIRLANAESLRLAANTTVLIEAADRFRLVEGRVYADSGDQVYRARQISIVTEFGTVTDVGTQFVVATEGGGLEVAVREGRVDVGLGTGTHTTIAGEIMRLGQQGETVVEPITAYDDYWSWAATLAPEFDIEGKSLMDFLRWAARETGRELVFTDPDLRMSAMRTDLHGSVAGFEPLEALASVLATTAYRYRVEADRIIIER